jgi:hypothetical protein
MTSQMPTSGQTSTSTCKGTHIPHQLEPKMKRNQEDDVVDRANGGMAEKLSIFMRMLFLRLGNLA